MTVGGSNAVASTLHSLATIFKLHGEVFDAEASKHYLAGFESVSSSEVIRQIRRQRLKAREIKSTIDRLHLAPLPALASDGDGGYLIVAKVGGGKVLLSKGAEGKVEALDLAAFAESWDGALILVTRRLSLSDTSGVFNFRWFLHSIHKYRWILGEVLLASLFLQLFALTTPIFFQVVVDKVLSHQGMSTLDVLIVGLLAVSLFETVLAVLRTYILSHTTNRIDVELGARLFRHLLALPVGYFGVRRVGDSVARVRELENIRQFLTGSALTAVLDALFAVIFVGVMAVYSWQLTLVVLLTLPLYVAISVVAAPLFRERLDEKFRRGAENQSLLVEVVGGVETIKAMAAEQQMQRRWEQQLAAYVSASFSVTSLANYASQAIQLVSKLATAAILFWGAKAVIGGEMTVGALVAFNMLAGRVAQPILRIAQMWQDFHQVRLSVERLGDVLNALPEMGTASGKAPLPAMQGRIAFDHVGFRYSVDGPEILCDVSFSVDAGEVIGVVGSSGSGKSTIAKLLQRLYIPATGRVFVDGADLAITDPRWLRRQIGVVAQESVLFHRSVRDNIALTDPGTDIHHIVSCAQTAGAHEFILKLPNGYDTIIGERGSTLSGGQKQRIAIARALISSPRILIFDEATSALDYESEWAIQRNMRKICEGRTVIIIAHRLSTVRACNRIIVVENGRILESGPHHELLKSGGRYASLHRMQEGVPDAA